MYAKVVVAAIAASVAAVFEGCKSHDFEKDLEKVYEDYTKKLNDASHTVDDKARVAECQKIDMAVQSKISDVANNSRDKSPTARLFYEQALTDCKAGAPAVQVINVYKTGADKLKTNLTTKTFG